MICHVVRWNPRALCILSQFSFLNATAGKEREASRGGRHHWRQVDWNKLYIQCYCNSKLHFIPQISKWTKLLNPKDIKVLNHICVARIYLQIFSGLKILKFTSVVLSFFLKFQGLFFFICGQLFNKWALQTSFSFIKNTLQQFFFSLLCGNSTISQQRILRRYSSEKLRVSTCSC